SSSDGASAGRCSWVNTSSTPSTASASSVWMRLIRPLAIAEETTKPCARPGTLYSAAYFAAPVTFAWPSMRDVGLPGWLVAVIALSRLSDPLVRSRLRRPARRLRQCSNDAAPRQLDFEVVVAGAVRVPQHRSAALRKLSRVAGAPLSCASA